MIFDMFLRCILISRLSALVHFSSVFRVFIRSCISPFTERTSIKIASLFTMISFLRYFLIISEPRTKVVAPGSNLQKKYEPVILCHPASQPRKQNREMPLIACICYSSCAICHKLSAYCLLIRAFCLQPSAFFHLLSAIRNQLSATVT